MATQQLSGTQNGADHSAYEPMSDADRAAHEAASYVRRPEPTPDLPKLPRDTAARRRALAVRGW